MLLKNEECMEISHPRDHVDNYTLAKSKHTIARELNKKKK